MIIDKSKIIKFFREWGLVGLIPSIYALMPTIPIPTLEVNLVLFLFILLLLIFLLHKVYRFYFPKDLSSQLLNILKYSQKIKNKSPFHNSMLRNVLKDTNVTLMEISDTPNETEIDQKFLEGMIQTIIPPTNILETALKLKNKPSFYQLMFQNVMKNAYASIKEISDTPIEHQTEEKFTEEVMDILKPFNRKPPKKLSESVRIKALCGKKPWGKPFVKRYFNFQYQFALKRYKGDDNKPVVIRIFLEPEGDFDRRNDEHKKILKTIDKHFVRLSIGVRPVIIKHEQWNNLIQEFPDFSKDLFDGFGFIIIETEIETEIKTKTGNKIETKLKKYLIVHHGEGNNFKYSKWEKESTIQEVVNVFNSLYIASKLFDPSKYSDIKIPPIGDVIPRPRKKPLKKNKKSTVAKNEKY